MTVIRNTAAALCVAIVGLGPMALAQEAERPNILIVLADDLGVEPFGVYGEHPLNVATPVLDGLAQEGVRFSRFWAQPACSPTRAATLTGRYGFRTGIEGPLYIPENRLGVDMPPKPDGAPYERDINFMGEEILPDSPPPPFAATIFVEGLPLKETTLAEALKALDERYATAAIGKWHLGGYNNGWLENPNLSGFDFFSGPLSGAVPSFYAWQHVENGEPVARTGYVDQYSVDTAVDWIGAQGDAPWFMWFSFINPHEPHHLPPTDLIVSEELAGLDPDGVTAETAHLYYRAMVEATDTLLGRLIDGIPEAVRDNTYIFFIGDNGIEAWSQPVEDQRPVRVKTTPYQGGVHVPAIVAGPGAPAGAVVGDLAHVVDIFATAIELAGGDAGELVGADRTLDGVSFAPLLRGEENPAARTWNFAGTDTPSLQRAMRDDTYKLITRGEDEELYDLAADPSESANLLAGEDGLSADAQTAYDALKAQMAALLASEGGEE